MADDHLAKKHHCPRKKPKLGRKEEFGRIDKIWKQGEKLEENEIFERIG